MALSRDLSLTRTVFPKSYDESNFHSLNLKAFLGKPSVKEIITSQFIFRVNPNFRIIFSMYNLTSELPGNFLS